MVVFPRRVAVIHNRLSALGDVCVCVCEPVCICQTAIQAQKAGTVCVCGKAISVNALGADRGRIRNILHYIPH